MRSWFGNRIAGACLVLGVMHAATWGAACSDGSAEADAAGTDTVGEVSEVSGCVDCHTDEERLLALLPPEPVEETEAAPG